MGPLNTLIIAILLSILFTSCFSSKVGSISAINRSGLPPNDPAVLAALQDFYKQLGGPHWIKRACWNVSSDGCSHYCLDWYGITCEGGLITNIELGRNNLSGTIPPSVTQIASLRVLKLNNNHIQGSIPDRIGDLANLTQLEIANNSVVGRLPDSIGLTSLTRLVASRNLITGPIPDSLFHLPLDHLDLGQNQISQSLPEDIGRLHKLRFLDLSRNALFGTLPSALSQLVHLEELVLHSNKITGTLEADMLVGLGSLRKLLLSQNQMNGTINAISILDNIRIVALNGNRFSGEIIPAIGSLLSLSTLDLSDNELSGSIPMEALRQMFVSGSLTFFNVYGNPEMKSPTKTPPSWLYEDPGVVDLEGTFKCNTLIATDRSTMILRVGPSYFNYWNCYCATGFYGTPPRSCMPCPDQALCVGSVITFPSGFFPVWDFNSKFNSSALRLQQCPQDAMSDMSGVLSVCNPMGNVTISYSNPQRGYTFNEDDLCASGRTGFMCTKCDCDLNDTNHYGAPNSCFYRRGNACAECSSPLSPRDSLIFATVFPVSICVALSLLFMLAQGTCSSCGQSYAPPVSIYVDRETGIASSGLSSGMSSASSSRKSMTSFAAEPRSATMDSRSTAPPSTGSDSQSEVTLSGHIKIFFIWIQTLAKVISWPQVWAVSTLAAVLDISNGQLLPLGFFCLMPILTNEVWNVLFYMLTPVGFIVIVVVALTIAALVKLIVNKASSNFMEEDYVNDKLLALPAGATTCPPWAPTLKHNVMRWILLVFYFLFFGVSVEALSLMNCSLNGGAGVRYLESRPFIACGSRQWAPLKTISTVFIPTYVVGIFLFFAILFLVMRQRIKEAAFGEGCHYTVKHVLGFLFNSYKPEMYWYEMVVFTRRLALALIVGILPSSSVFKAFFSFVALLISLLVQSWLQPFRTTIENRTEELGLVMLITTFGSQFVATTSTGTPVEHSDILFLMLLCFDGLFMVFMLVGLCRTAIQKAKCCAPKRKRSAREKEYRRSTKPYAYSAKPSM